MDVRKQIKFFGISLGVIAVLMLTLCISVARFNNQERVLYYSKANAEEDNSAKDCAVTIKSRGGNTDAWIKRVQAENSDGVIEETQYAGIIYDMMIVNQTEFTVKDWTLEVLIPQDSYINNAWCGQLEIHQNVTENERVQVLDLRKCIEQEVEIILAHEVSVGDLMIPVYDGDYFVYLPSVGDHEDIIEASDTVNGEYQSKRVDFIAYHETVNEDQTPVEFPDAVLRYHLNEELTSLPAFWGLVVALGVWVICLINTYVVYVRTKRLVAETQHDAQIIEQAISAFMGFIDAKDTTTNGHSKRVAKYARALAKRMGFTESECNRVYYIGLMHDCGKIGIPDAILNKPDKLTEDEFEIIKTHTTQGYKILEEFTSIDGIREGALYHHERFDGMGYPEGLEGKAIPLIARIICVADSFDVMNSERCYRQKLTKEDVVEQLKANKGKQFDPKLVDVFLTMLEDGTIEF